MKSKQTGLVGAFLEGGVFSKKENKHTNKQKQKELIRQQYGDCLGEEVGRGGGGYRGINYDRKK